MLQSMRGHVKAGRLGEPKKAIQTWDVAAALTRPGVERYACLSGRNGDWQGQGQACIVLECRRKKSQRTQISFRLCATNLGKGYCLAFGRAVQWETLPGRLRVHWRAAVRFSSSRKDLGVIVLLRCLRCIYSRTD